MFYLFHGDDSHSAQQTLDELKAKLGDPEMLSLNTTRLEGRSLNANQLADVCNAMPFLSPKRLVIVEDFFKHKPDKQVQKAILEYLPTMPDTARLIWLESAPLKENHAAVKLARSADNGYEKRFEKPKGRALEQWVLHKSDQLGGRIEPQAAMLLAANVGSDLDILERELEKLVLYKGISPEPDSITAADVQKLSPLRGRSQHF